MEFYARWVGREAGTKITGQFRVNHSVKFALIIIAIMPMTLCILDNAPVATALVGIVWLVGTFLFFSYRKHRVYQSSDDQSYVIDYIKKVVEAKLKDSNIENEQKSILDGYHDIAAGRVFPSTGNFNDDIQALEEKHSADWK